MSNEIYYIIRNHEIEKFIKQCMIAVGSKPDHAQMLAECLVEADYIGHYSHGLNRLGQLEKKRVFT